MHKMLPICLIAAMLLAGCSTTDSVPVPIAPVTDDSSWSSPTTWGGTLPNANSSITIPEGKTVVLDTNAVARNLTIKGKLVCADKDIQLTANWVMVHAPGKLECGTPTQPFTKKLTIILNATNATEDVMGMGTKFFSAMGGTVDLHSASKTSWTKLDGTVQAGSSQIKVLTANNWRVGDRLAIAPTDFEPTEAEERTITAISGTTISLDTPLEFRHWGKIQTLGSTGQTLDQRAEIGNLSRNITVRGQNVAGSYFGGHVMFMGNATARIAGVEFAGLGQLERLGRYPVHFHLLGDGGQGSYLKDSAVHHTLQRGVVLHRSNNILVQNNVVFDVTGHAMFLESSTEIGNTFDNNLVMLVRLVPKAFRGDSKEFEFRDGFAGAQLNNLHNRMTPAGFWISNQHNRLTNNTVAGVQFGYGYWYAEAEMSSARDVPDLYNNGNIFQGFSAAGQRRPFLQFEGNTAHSINAKNDVGRTTQYASPMSAGLFLETLWYFPNQPETTPVFKDFRVWKSAHTGVWAQTFNLQGLTYQQITPIIDGLVASDNRTALFVEQGAGPTKLRNSVLYGFTDNIAAGRTAPTRSFDWTDYWRSLSNSLENVDILPVATSPSFFPVVNDITPEMALGLRANDGKDTPVFLEWSNVITKGWAQ